MARIKKALKEMFDSCQSYGDIFRMIGEAKRQGYSLDEINTAASYRKNSFAKEIANNYKKLDVTMLNTRSTTNYMTTNVVVSNLTSNKIEFTGQKFIL